MDLREIPAEASARHPWERARYRFFADLLARNGALSSPISVLDVGSGDVYFSRQLLAESAPRTRICCWDTSYDEHSAAALGVFSISRLSLTRSRPLGKYDLILALDVLEHVQDDDALLWTLKSENLRPGGLLLLSVPAFPALYSRHDARLLHHRRYSPQMLRELLAGAGLNVIEAGGLFHSLLLPRALEKLHELISPAKEHEGTPSMAWRHGPFTTQLVYGLLRLDNLLSRATASPTFLLPGLSLWALCKT